MSLYLPLFVCSGTQLLESLCAPSQAMRVSFIAQFGLLTSLAVLLQPQVNVCLPEPSVQ